jgi:hypothetical protein
MDYEEMLHSMLCRNCYDGPGWGEYDVVSSKPGEAMDKPTMLCIETWYVDYENEGSNIIERVFYYHLWCRKCLPAELR